MSDAVTNAEVEDVLSSIRRLVSEDRRPLNRSQSGNSLQDKLVLTPSLRVSNDRPLSDNYRKKDDAAVTEWDNALSTDPETDPLGADEVLNDAGAPSEDRTDVDLVDDRLGDAQPFGNAASFEDEALITDDLPEDEAQDEVAEAESSGEDSRPSNVRTLGYRPDILNLGASELVEGGTPAQGADRLSAKIAALETAVARIPGEWDADEPEEDGFVAAEPLAMAWEDDVDLDATGSPVPQTAGDDAAIHDAEQIVDDADYADEDGFDDDETAEVSIGAKGLAAEDYLDEEMLRDMVSEIVRAELQGALGERITRNVRKLVRREIHRALAAQELE